MKKFLGILVLSLITCNISFAACIVGDCKNNKGTMTYADGSKYVGSFRDGFFNGRGTMTYTDGSKYVGEFKDGLYYGYGNYKDKDSKVHAGHWKDGILISQ